MQEKLGKCVANVFVFYFFLTVEHEQSGNELRVDADWSSECVLYQRVLRGLNFFQLQSDSWVMVILSCALNPKYPLKTLVLGTWLIVDRLWGIDKILRSLQRSLDSRSGFLGNLSQKCIPCSVAPFPFPDYHEETTFSTTYSHHHDLLLQAPSNGILDCALNPFRVKFTSYKLFLSGRHHSREKHRYHRHEWHPYCDYFWYLSSKAFGTCLLEKWVMKPRTCLLEKWVTKPRMLRGNEGNPFISLFFFQTIQFLLIFENNYVHSSFFCEIAIR